MLAGSKADIIQRITEYLPEDWQTQILKYAPPQPPPVQSEAATKEDQPKELSFAQEMHRGRRATYPEALAMISKLPDQNLNLALKVDLEDICAALGVSKQGKYPPSSVLLVGLRSAYLCIVRAAADGWL